MKTHEICPVCCAGSMHEYKFSSELKYKNVTLQVSTFESSKCEVCSSVSPTHEQSKRNKLVAVNFQRAVDGLLSTHEVLRIRKATKLNQSDASRVLGGGGKAFSKYENGTVRQSVAVDNVLRLIDKYPNLIQDLVELDMQRRALAYVETEIYIPAAALEHVADTSCSSGVGLFKQFVNAAQTVFQPILSVCRMAEQTHKDSNSFGFIGFKL